MDAASEPERCPHCSIIFNKDNNKWNNKNIERHIECCKTKTVSKAPKKRKNIGIINYFKPKKALEITRTEELADIAESTFEGDNEIRDNSTEIGDTVDPTNNEMPANLPDDQQNVHIPDISKANSICSGYVVPSISGIYSIFPFQLLKDIPQVIFENGVFHHQDCSTNGYQLFKTDPVNECCSNLKYHTRLNKITERIPNNEIHLSQTQNKYLSFSQLDSRLHSLQRRLSVKKMENLNCLRKNQKLVKSLELHQRFLMLIKDNSVPKLHELVKVALKSKHSINDIINQVVNAVDGTYNARSSNDDKDIAFLIMQFGGPGLLDICHRALNLPSVSTACRILKSSKAIISSINTPLKGFSNNIDVDFSKLPRYGFMLKIDETYIDPRVKWNPSDNHIYGVCYEHGRNTDMEFTSYEN